MVQSRLYSPMHGRSSDSEFGAVTLMSIAQLCPKKDSPLLDIAEPPRVESADSTSTTGSSGVAVGGPPGNMCGRNTRVGSRGRVGDGLEGEQRVGPDTVQLNKRPPWHVHHRALEGWCRPLGTRVGWPGGRRRAANCIEAPSARTAPPFSAATAPGGSRSMSSSTPGATNGSGANRLRRSSLPRRRHGETPRGRPLAPAILTPRFPAPATP